MIRSETTAMGAYTQFTNGQDLMLMQFPAWNNEVIMNQTIPINVSLFNMGIVPVTSATFGWSINGAVQTPVSWTATPALDSLEQRTIFIGSFPVTNTPNYDVVVWIDNINGQADTVNWNDTIQTLATLKPLAEFAAPFVPDTVTDLSFPVNVLIRSWTGAPTIPPVLTIVSTIHGTQTIYDTIPMVQVGDLWQAVIPPQYYGAKVIYSVTIADTLSNSITLTDSTCIRNAISILQDPALISLSLAEPLNTTGCMPDYTPVKVTLINKGTTDYDFARDTIVLHLEVTDPDTLKHTASVPFAGVLQAGTNIIELMDSLPTVHPGIYAIKAWISSPTDNTPFKDTLFYTYISGKVGLPIDADFSSGIPLEFEVWGNNTSASWIVISQGMGVDTVVKPVFGDSILVFTGSRGAMSTFATRQMDLSRTLQPALSFWYFHDTIPCKDYTDVRITIDGGATYNTLFSLTKYDAVYGWKQYSVNLPTYAINQCVILAFEAMEKSFGDVTQYIDRILITARQDIAVSEVITPLLTTCDLENKEIKLVMKNLSDPTLNYDSIVVTLEVKEAGQTQPQIFRDTLTSGSLGSMASDTITLTTDFNFSKGTYTFKAYFSSVLDVDRQNDTLVTTFVINPAVSVRITQESGGNSNCLAGETEIQQTITIYNTGNLAVSGLNFSLYVEGYDEPLTGTDATTLLQSGDSLSYQFQSYVVPWVPFYSLRAVVSLQCDSVLVNASTYINECVDINDLILDSILNPTGSQNDRVGERITVSVSLSNRGNTTHQNVPITVRIDNSQGIQQSSFSGSIEQIDILSDTTFVFATAYTVPDDTVYSITVYVESQDRYKDNDTLYLTRRTDKVGISAIDAYGISLGQNIPNPADDRTEISYSVPTDGSVTFKVYSISGQVMYSQTVETSFGTHSIELNTSDLAAGLYFYSMEFKGQRLVKRMVIKN
jgi:hypothetical protein